MKRSVRIVDETAPGPATVDTAIKPKVTARSPRQAARELLAELQSFDPSAGQRALSRLMRRSGRQRPGFAASWVSPEPPEGVTRVGGYDLEGCHIDLYLLPNRPEGYYHATPEEYGLDPEELDLVLAARARLLASFPETISLTDVERTRQYVETEALRTLKRESALRSFANAPDVDKLSGIVARYTAGYGILEVLFRDPHVQDVYINAPASDNPLRVTMGDAPAKEFPQRALTNITLGPSDEDGLLSRLRYESGRPFSEAFPLLECNLPAFETRVTLVGPPLSPGGIALALRRHATEAWTLPRLMKRGSLDALTAGLLSLLIDAQCTIIVAGGRGAGKTSLLSALLFEIPRGNRILTIEDTPELPVTDLQELGYQTQRLVVRSSLGGRSEFTADDALRIALRLGESAIVMGEVRGQEARTLYESMRAGTAGSTVLGTFHGDSAEAVFRRAKDDMQIPAGSFAATDVVVIAGLVREQGAGRAARRLVQVAEFDKEDPAAGKFHDLVAYDVSERGWRTTEAFERGSALLGAIAKRWGRSYFDIIREVEARATVRRVMVEEADRLNKPSLLSAASVAVANGAYAECAARTKGDHDQCVAAWTKWFREGPASH